MIALFGCGGRLVYLQARLKRCSAHSSDTALKNADNSRSALAVFMKNIIQSSRLKCVSIDVVF